jgi:hypothetical protein
MSAYSLPSVSSVAGQPFVVVDLPPGRPGLLDVQVAIQHEPLHVAS